MILHQGDQMAGRTLHLAHSAQLASMLVQIWPSLCADSGYRASGAYKSEPILVWTSPGDPTGHTQVTALHIRTNTLVFQTTCSLIFMYQCHSSDSLHGHFVPVS
jgi:hypothetical protein